MRMRKAVFKSGHAKIVYVMNGWNRFKASRDFMERFEGLAGDQTVVTLPQSEAFVQAGSPVSLWSSSTDAARQRGDACVDGHRARGCGVPEGITAGRRRCPPA